MLPRITEVRHVKNYQLDIRFSDGTVAEIDFRRRIVGRGGVFQRLEDMDVFAQVTVDPESGTLVWPNGIDFCPDVLYAEATGKSITELESTVEVI
jgi:hypothetical protein